MGDNTVLNKGITGDTISTDDIGAYKVERVKLITGAAGVDGGNVTAANPLPVQIRDSSGNTPNLILDDAGQYGLASSIVQNVHADATNSSAANLAAGATFTGTKHSTLGVAGIQLMLKATVASGTCTCTVYVDQSGDGTNYDITDSYTYVSTRNFSRTVQAVGSDFRVRVTNNSATTTNLFRLNTALCPVVEALPRSVDAKGSLQAGIYALNDQFGFSGQFNPVHSLQVAQPYRLVGTTFGAAIDAVFWTASNGGGAGAASGVASSIATIASGTATTATGYGKLISTRFARFIFAHPHKWRGAMRVTSVAVANSAQRGWGPVSLGSAGTVVTPQNGPFFSMDAAGVLTCCYASNGTTIAAVASGSFNGDVSQYIMDTNVHAFEIIYFTMGIWYFIDGVLIHSILPTTAVLYLTATTPISVWSVNNGTGGTSGVVECWNSVIVRLGRDVTAPTSYYITGANAGAVLKIGSGAIHAINISTINNNATIVLYDATSVTGTPIWAMDSGNTDKVTSLNFAGMPFFTGLTAVTTGAGTKVTVVYE